MLEDVIGMDSPPPQTKSACTLIYVSQPDELVIFHCHPSPTLHYGFIAQLVLGFG